MTVGRLELWGDSDGTSGTVQTGSPESVTVQCNDCSVDVF